MGEKYAKMYVLIKGRQAFLFLNLFIVTIRKEEDDCQTKYSSSCFLSFYSFPVLDFLALSSLSLLCPRLSVFVSLYLTADYYGGSTEAYAH